tara:strand:- start:5446 stop:6018 length:573 start_codon:yes stop_codon:yes gene_type:complete
MSFVLYYSKYCENCKKLLYTLGKSDIQKKTHFLNIDKRIKEKNKIFVLLDNGQKILLPPMIKEVPALLMLNRGNQILFGKDVMNFYKPLIREEKQEAVKVNGEPMAYSFHGEMGTTMSDNYSYLDQTAEELKAKGNGGLRQMHNFVTLSHKDVIETPPEDYEPDKVGTVDLSKIQGQREMDIRKIQNKVQ